MARATARPTDGRPDSLNTSTTSLRLQSSSHYSSDYKSFTNQSTTMTSAEDANAAKQLDSVTDNIVDTELDSSKAQQSLSVLKKDEQDAKALLAKIKVKQADVDIIVNELEVSEDKAEATLRQVSLELQQNGKISDQSSTIVVETALRRLIIPTAWEWVDGWRWRNMIAV